MKKYEIDVRKFTTDFDGYKYSLTFVGNPSCDYCVEILSELFKHYKNKLHIFCSEKDFSAAIKKIQKQDLLSEGETESFSKCRHDTENSEEMVSQIYNASKINLHIAAKENAKVPKQVFEILASGGFLISSEMKNLKKYFEASKHLETFKNKVDLIDKIDFYLENLNIAQKVAQLGRFEIIKKHSVSIVRSKA